MSRVEDAEKRVLPGLRELRDAHCIDLRLKHALIFGTDDGVAPSPSTSAVTTLPVVARDTGAFDFATGGVL